MNYWLKSPLGGRLIRLYDAVVSCHVWGGAWPSAFFSGTETGFYRVAKVRLVMDAKSGGWVSKALLWIANHTSLIVATVLIGNNLANYLISLSLVLLSSRCFRRSRNSVVDSRFDNTLDLRVWELMPKLLASKCPTDCFG